MRKKKPVRRATPSHRTRSSESAARKPKARVPSRIAAGGRRPGPEPRDEYKRRYRSLFENMLNGFAFCRMILHNGQPADFIYLDVNKAFKHLTGLDDVVGRKVSEVIPGLRNSNPELFDTFAKVVSTGKPEVFETYIDPLKMWFSISVYSPQKEHFVALFNVVTERKQADEQLRKSEENYRILFENHPHPMWVYDLRTTAFLAVNDAAIEKYGYSREEFLGMTLADIRPTEDLARLEQSVKGPRPDLQHSGAWRHTFKDGRTIDVDITSHKIDMGGRQAALVVAFDITDRKKAENALRESEERFRNLFENASIGIYRTTPDGRFLLANPAFVRMVGFSSFDELSRQNLETGTYFPRYSRSEFRRQMETDGQIVGLEKAWTLKDGTKVFMRESAKAIRGLDGRILYYEGTVEDITERVLAEQKVLRLNRTYAVLSNINQLIVREKNRTDLLKKACAIAVEDGKFRMAWIGFADEMTDKIEPEASAGTAEDYLNSIGIMRNDGPLGRGPTGTAVRDNVPSYVNDIEHDPRMAPWREKALALGFRSSAAFPLRSRGKAAGAISFYSGEQDFFDEEEIRLLEELAMDISYALESLEIESERRKAEESLTRLNAAVDASGEVVFTTDHDGLFTFVNAAFVRLYGFTADEVIGKATPRILKSGRQSPQHYQTFWNALSNREIVKGEWINRAKDGRFLIIEGTANPILGGNGSIVGFLAIQRDVTQQRNLEGQMRQAQKMESVGTLASGIAHDFNNILGIIMGHASLIERFRNDPARLAESIENILSASKRGASLVRQVLAFARKSEVEIKPMFVNDSVREMERILRETFPRTITIESHLADQLPLIGADFTQVHQVLLNLCINARDAMEGNGTLRLATSLVSGDVLRTRFVKAVHDSYVVLEVSDTGGGMDEPTRLRIFEPFFTTKGIGKGTGLGLAVAFGIMENHGGFIDVRSDLGRGTSFALYFPVVPQSQSATVSEDVPKTEIKGGTETILVVEDEEMLRESVRLNLTAKGYTVLTAEDGQEAVSTYEQQHGKIALVFSDFGLPKLSGHEVLKRIRKINPGVKFILVSGFVDPFQRSEILKDGALDVMNKPFNSIDLLMKIRTTLDG